MANKKKRPKYTGKEEDKVNDKQYGAVNENDDTNLGLDADHSSEGDDLQIRMDGDNERIIGNPDGESDTNNAGERKIYSPLDDK